MEAKIKSGVAMLEILEKWGVDHVYGIPGGSFNSIMNAFNDRQDTIRYIQVRHEETGALAAAADAKLTGKIGVCFGTAGPGATHLFNGLYDAQQDKVPVLALVGQVSSKLMNYDWFQEMNENPMFADVSVYNRTVMTPESLPSMVDDAIRKAYEGKGVAVVTIPVDYGYTDIPADDACSATSHRTGYPVADQRDIEEAARFIALARRPILYIGQGVRGASEEVLAFSRHFSMPIVISVLAKGILPDRTPDLLGTSWRLGTKPANEALPLTDLIVFVGSDFPFAKVMFPKDCRFIQIDCDPSKLGKRHKTDVAILGDAKIELMRLMSAGSPVPETDWLLANRENRRNWTDYLRRLEELDQTPLSAEPVFRKINRVATDDAVFVVDVGNVTVHAVRSLDMNGSRQRFTTSGLFATMGYGVPGGIAARLSFPDRQVFTLSGDGGFAMVMQDVITQVKYGLPVINVVFSNDSFGFIEAEQEDTQQPKFGVALQGADYAKIAEGMGAVGFFVTRKEQLPAVFDQAASSSCPVVIDVKIGNRRPFPAETMPYNSDRFTEALTAEFIARYNADGMTGLKKLLDDREKV